MFLFATKNIKVSVRQSVKLAVRHTASCFYSCFLCLQCTLALEINKYFRLWWNISHPSFISMFPSHTVSPSLPPPLSLSLSFPPSLSLFPPLSRRNIFKPNQEDTNSPDALSLLSPSPIIALFKDWTPAHGEKTIFIFHSFLSKNDLGPAEN